MASGRRRLLFIGLAVLAIASLWRAAAVEGEKRRLAEAHAKIQHAMNELEDERNRLTGQLAEARQTLGERTDDLSRFTLELQQAQRQLASLQREHEELLAHDRSMSDQVSALTTEKQELEAKLSSVKELRLAIRDLTRKVWQERWAVWRGRLRAHRHADQDRLLAGNRGYVVRDGASTLGESPRVHVHVLEPQAQ